MLCPEVWNFSLKSEDKLVHQFGVYDNKAKQNIEKFMKRSFFNNTASIVLPNCEAIPPTIQDLFDTSDYYLIRNLKICDLVRRDFVEAFVKRGKVTGISLEAGVFDCREDVFLLTPEGKLILVVNKELYQLIGLQGRPAASLNGCKDRFEITIDLKAADFVEQTKLHDRIKSSLSSPEIEQLDFQLSWQPADGSVCTSSIAKFFYDCGYKVEQHSVQIQTSTTSDLKIPCKLFERGQIDSNTAQELAEYFGTILLSCDINMSEELSSYKPSLNLNLHNEDYVQAVILHCKGLLTADSLVKLLELARVSTDGKVIFSVNAFEQALPMGSNSYTLSLVDDTKFILLKT